MQTVMTAPRVARGPPAHFASTLIAPRGPRLASSMIWMSCNRLPRRTSQHYLSYPIEGLTTKISAAVERTEITVLSVTSNDSDGMGSPS